MPVELLVVGGGRMGAALVGGLMSAGRAAAADLCIVEPDAMRREALREMFDDVRLETTPLESAATVLAVKPAHAEEACRAVAGAGTGRVLSIVAGVTTSSLEAWSRPGTPVVRAMPNTPALVGAGVAAICPGAHATHADLDWAESVLCSVGAVVRLPEEQLDAVTGLSGSGPAYVFLLAEAMVAAGVEAGLEAGAARTLALGTVTGAGNLLAATGEDPEVLRAQVTSPGGTTEAGLAVLEAAGLRRIVSDAVAAATARSRARPPRRWLMMVREIRRR